MQKKKFFKSLVSMLCIFTLFLSVPIHASATSSISGCSVTTSASVVYTGKALKPKITVKRGTTKLVLNRHYTVKYYSNVNFGTGKAVITGMKSGGYTGSKTVKFNIIPGKTMVTATCTANSVTLKWNKISGATKYNIYSYNTSTKKYKQIAVTTSNNYVVKNLQSGITYSYAVKALAIKNTVIYSSKTSSIVSVTTRPGKVYGLKASSTDNSITLTWNKVERASGYYVYFYNSSNKSYSKIATITTNRATIKNLLCNQKYQYAVSAYKIVSKKTYVGSKSNLVSVATKYKDYLEKYQKIFRSGVFYAQYSLKQTGNDTSNVITAAKNGNVLMDATYMDTNCKMFYLDSKNTGYAIFEDYKLYCKFSPEEAMAQGLNINSLVRMFAPAMDPSSKVVERKATLSGKSYNCSSYKTFMGSTVKYYFIGGILKRMDTVNSDGTTTVVIFSKIASDVPDSLFALPNGFPRGYIKITL